MPARILRYFILLVVFSISSSGLLAQNQSVFAEDTCAPPCWFGLTAGESTTNDVENLIAQYLIEEPERFGVFDEMIGFLITGFYRFTIPLSETLTVYAYVEVRNSVVDYLSIAPETYPNVEREYISMQTALARLGEADLIYVYDDGAFFGHNRFHLSFIYLESRMRVEFGYHPSPGIGCDLPTITEQMILEQVSFFSPTAAQVLERHPNRDELQPALTAFHINESLVLPEDWQAILNGEIDDICRLIPAERNVTDTAPLIFVEPSIRESLFAEDTCAPPCWFGLTAGESSAEDVLAFVENSDLLFREWLIAPESIFDEASGLMQSGGYYSDWLFAGADFRGYTFASLRVRNGTLTSLAVRPNNFILLHEVLSKLGSPTLVFINVDDVTGATMEFIYEDLALSLRFRSIWSNCQLGRMSNQFWVDDMAYYQPSSIQDTISRINYYSGDSIVTPEIWQQWLSGEISGSCRTAWQDVLNSSD